MHFNIGGEEIVHDCESDVLLVALVAIHPEELGQEGVRVLVQVHVVPGQELLQELGLFVLDGLQDKLVVVSKVEDTARGTGIAEFAHWLIAYRHLEWKKSIKIRIKSSVEKGSRYNISPIVGTLRKIRLLHSNNLLQC